MKQIKFSHRYKKMPLSLTYGERAATLLQVLKVHYDDLSDLFIEYDTSYKDGNYPIPKTDLIFLLFQTREGKLFTTIRRFTDRKWEYYKKAEGEKFEVVIE